MMVGGFLYGSLLVVPGGGAKGESDDFFFSAFSYEAARS
jgi:hypothetical protein